MKGCIWADEERVNKKGKQKTSKDYFLIIMIQIMHIDKIIHARSSQILILLELMFEFQKRKDTIQWQFKTIGIGI